MYLYECPDREFWQEDFSHLLDAIFEESPHSFDDCEQDYHARLDYENECFEVHRFDWSDPDCTCGADAAIDRYIIENGHRSPCLILKEQTVRDHLKTELEKYKSLNSGEKTAALEAHIMEWAKGAGLLDNDLTATRFIPYCTCGWTAHLESWIRDHGHGEQCALMRPNFWHKSTDFKLQFYKYPMRGVHCSHKLTNEMFHAIISDCIDSLKPVEKYSFNT